MTIHAPVTPFSRQLREATWARHESVDPTGDDADEAAGDDEPGILAALLDGELHLDDYAAMSGQLYFVYKALDEASRLWRDDPVAGPFVDPKLSRLTAIDADMTLLRGKDWRDSLDPLPSTRRYLTRLGEIDSAGSFVAHHYTRYLGDLSGGQAFRAAANATYGFADGAGVKLYIFDGIADCAAYKQQYRRELDNANWDARQRERIIDEVLDAYDFNEAILCELSKTMKRSV